ncbi:MAG: S-methyl-5'-thioadenosine phosphorylase [Chloroflexota bacterium]|nr:S-methyl-5'-thioadenosine phosphorylase [Chloroflexota bacterium]
MMPEAKIGVIGGTGLYEIEGLTGIEEVKPETPFGEPSDSIIIGELDGTKIAFLPRHGRGHSINPTEIPARANIYALKSLGVEWIISVSAVGSLKENIHPIDLVIPNQIIDRTRSRINTFFTDGIVAHVGFAQPFCPHLSDILYKSAIEEEARVHPEGTYIIMEGPLFSTKAESNLYRSWGASIIGMTALPEAKLAREAEICYATLACVTDYDVWHETEEEVTIEIAVANLNRTADIAKRIVRRATAHIPNERECHCAQALNNAILTDPELISQQTKRDLELLIGKYI